MTTLLDRVIPTPRLLETDHIEVAAPPAIVWERVRHGDLGSSLLIRTLFALRTLPERLLGKPPITTIRIDDLVSTVERPGFRVLAEEAPHEVAIGAIGKVWQSEIPFVHLNDAAEFAAFEHPDQIKVAWAIRTLPWAEQDTRIEIEVRVDATDEAAWRKFQRYFRFIGPASRFIRQTLLAELADEFGPSERAEQRRPLPGDDLLPDASARVTHGITITATPERIWPWLVQIGCGRAGFYAIDALDNGGVASAREIHPEWQRLRVGQVLAATPNGDEGFEVLRIDEPRTLILGGLYDPVGKRQLPFVAPRPMPYWHVTWAFVLEPLDETRTRLLVRARAAYSPDERLHAAWIRPVHVLMQHTMLRHLAERAEGRHFQDVQEVLDGVGGAAIMLLGLLSPFLRKARSHWGVDRELAELNHPGDALIREPRWSWTHAVEIEAPAAEVWPWVAQVGADRAGFYSYQWLENLVGCEIHNAEQVHLEWQVTPGQTLSLHPDDRAPKLRIVEVEPGHHFVAFGEADESARREGKPWSSASWLFLVEPLGTGRCRFTSRFRAACSSDLATRLAFGPTLLEPIGFAMDRRMLLGVKARVESRASQTRTPIYEKTR